MFYLAQVFRNESNEIVERRLMGKSPRFDLVSKYEHIIIIGQTDFEIDICKVSLNESQEPFIEVDESKVALKASEENLKIRKLRREFGGRLIDIMSQRNEEKDLSTEEIVELANTFADINKCWLNGSISTSRVLVNAITPDGIVLTADDKSAILNEIDNNLNQLGY